MTTDAETGPETAVTITYDGEWYVVRDAATGVTSQGQSRAMAFRELADAIDLYDADDDIDDADLRVPDVPWFATEG